MWSRGTRPLEVGIQGNRDFAPKSFLPKWLFSLHSAFSDRLLQPVADPLLRQLPLYRGHRIPEDGGLLV